MEGIMMTRWMTFLIAALSAAGSAFAQNPIQWHGNAREAIARAKEQQLPLMFWVTQRRDLGEQDDLRDEEEHAFRDPTVVAIAQRRYVPVRISHTSRVDVELEKLGLPTGHGLYVALVTPSGDLLDTVGPMDVANPTALAQRLSAAYRKYADDLYERELAPVIRNQSAPKADVRRAVQTAWRLGVTSADKDIAALLARPDVTEAERGRIYALLASLATGPSIEALLAAAAEGSKDAAAALGRADAGALEFLLDELPGAEGEPSGRQLAAYQATARIARLPGAKPETFWMKAPAEDRAKELDVLKTRAESVLAYWKEREGAGR